MLDTAATRPDLKVVCGFSRRSDASYGAAYEKVQQGLIGRPTVMRCQSCDILDPTGQFVSYAAVSGGVFVDSCTHDIDLALWFFGKEAKIKSVHAIGTAACHPDLRQYNDSDNAIGMMEFHDGRMVSLFASRTMAAGAEDSTEIIGTKGKLVVNMMPRGEPRPCLPGWRGFTGDAPELLGEVPICVCHTSQQVCRDRTG